MIHLTFSILHENRKLPMFQSKSLVMLAILVAASMTLICGFNSPRAILRKPIHTNLYRWGEFKHDSRITWAGMKVFGSKSPTDSDAEPTLGAEVTAPTITDRISSIELNDELKSSFMSYALSTILGRALPDARDGLKPVHRRVLYAMHCLNLTPESSYRKCARVVGEVLGKFHPHGDQSVYDALVRMAQDFVMLHPLIAGHGNFGSVDDDPPAAMRYTESKLSLLAYDSLLADIKENTVDFNPNFDGSEIEPVVLPARLPILLLNGASGIAVGMATNIPPHNLGELCDAIVAIVDKPSLTDAELMRIIPAPDFPTGGKILGLAGSQKLYTTGGGSVIMRANSKIETITSNTGKVGGVKSRPAIVITELPYMTNKAALLEKIADLVNDKKIEGISDIRDESDRDGIRVVIELKRDAVPAIVQNNLYKRTALQTSFSGNMLAVVEDGKQPQRLTLRGILDIFIKFRFDTLRRRSRHQLEKVKTRSHIVEGMLLALARIDDIIDLIRTSKDNAHVKASLNSPEYGLSLEQAEAILGLRLGRLTALEEEKFKQERLELAKQIDQLSGVMKEDHLVYDIMKQETMTLKQQYGQKRRSEICIDEEGILADEDLIPNDRCVVIMTRSGYIKRLPMEEFEAQSRGSKGKVGTRMSTDSDSVSQFFTCNSHDAILFVSDKGVAYKIKAFQVPLASRTAKGVPIPQVLPISAEELITSVIPVDTFSGDDYLILLTSQGYMKRTPIKAFESVTTRGLVIISLRDGDALNWVRRCQSQDEVVVATRDGVATKFAISEIGSSGRSSMGLQALRLSDGDEMADMDILSFSNSTDTSELHFLVITEQGYGKRIPIDEFRTKKRRGVGVLAIKFKDKAGGDRRTLRNEGGGSKSDALRCMRVCKPDEDVVISTSRGTIVRQRVDDLSIQSRTATGVLIQKLAEDDTVMMVDVVSKGAEIDRSIV